MLRKGEKKINEGSVPRMTGSLAMWSNGWMTMLGRKWGGQFWRMDDNGRCE